MKPSEAFFYKTDDGHKYWLAPEYQLTPGSIAIIGCGIHDMDGKYLGYWDNFNMPLPLIRQIKKWVLFNKSVEVAERIRKARKPLSPKF